MVSEFPVDFKAYVILNFTELRTQLGLLARKAVVPHHSEAPSDSVDDFNVTVRPDCLQGLPAFTMKEWAEFDHRLRTENKFAKDVVMTFN